MCQQQCRDANGFKCHKTSEGHQRMMKIFVENSGKILDQFSRDFERNFVALVRLRWRSKRVFANKVYNEYISDKTHRHMNSTVWESLAGFVQHLGRTGQCIVDKTEKGWYIKYVDRDPEVMARQALIATKEKMEVDDEVRGKRLMDEMFNATKDLEPVLQEPTEIKKKDDEQIVFKLDAVQKPEAPKPKPNKRFFGDTEDDPNETPPDPETAAPLTKRRKPNDAGTSSLDSIAAQIKQKQLIEQEKKEKKEHSVQTQQKQVQSLQILDHWLYPGIVVKITNKTLSGGAFEGKKGVVTKVIDLYVALVKVLSTDITVKIDQEHLETVIPAIGNPVLIVNGAHRGEPALLKKVDVAKFKAIVEVKGTEVEKEYEHICKVMNVD